MLRPEAAQIIGEWLAAVPAEAASNRVDHFDIGIATTQGTTALSLNVFLRSSHKTMPNLMMERREADDLVAYILSLKR